MAENFSITSDRLDCVQLLRAIAALAVVSHHLPLFGNGAWGVDLFFIISGFIMCYVTESSGRHFFLKRLIRIVPLYWLGTLGVGFIFLLMPHLIGKTLINTETFCKSLFFIPFQNGKNIYPILNVGWTLNYEMAFYLLFCLAMMISHRYRMLVASGLLLITAIGGYLWQTMASHSDSVIMAFYTDPIILEFSLGMLCYLFFRNNLEKHRHTVFNKQVIVWTLVGMGFIASMPFIVNLDLPLHRTLLYGVPSACAFSCIVLALAKLRLPLWIIALGDASYSLYLFHPYMLEIFRQFFHMQGQITVASYLASVAALLFSCCVALGIYFCIEKPLTNVLRRNLIH